MGENLRLQLGEDEDREEQFHFSPWTREEVTILAAGLAPAAKRAEAMAFLSFDDVLTANALKPVRGEKP